jgi:spartin
MFTTSDAHILVTIPSATLTSSSSAFTGQLALEYITFDIPALSADTSATATRDVLLVLRIGVGNGAFEAPLDPARALTVSTLPSGTVHRYVFHATRDDAEFSVDVPVTPETADDVELFHSVLVGYAADVRGDVQPQPRQPANPEEEEDDLRGRFVLMNEDSGEIIGALDPSVRVHEDPSLGEKGREEDPVVVELPEDADALGELRDLDVLVRTIPPEDRDWMLKGAVFARHVLLSLFPPLANKVGGIQLCHLWHNHPAHERDDHRLEHVHLPFDASIIHQHASLKLKLKLASSPRPAAATAFAHAPPPAVPVDPETPDSHPRRQRRRRTA